jgi:hypothetical protein
LIKTAAAGVPRFDHNPTTGESLGLMVEPAATNFNTNSGGFSGWGSVNGGGYSADVGIAPDNTFTADLFDSAGGGYMQKQIAYAAGQTYTFSAFVKPGLGSVVRIQIYNVGYTGEFRATFDLSNNTFSHENFSPSVVTVTNQGIDNYLNGWKRIKISFNFTTASSSLISLSFWHDFAGRNNYYAWGIQIEAGSFPTSYIPTSGSTVTRTPDVATLSNANSSIFPTSAFTTVNSPFGTAGGGSTVKLVGPTIKRTAIYDGDLTQAQINALAGVNDNFWRWRVLGATFALPNFTTNGSVTVDWGDGTVQTLTTGVYTFTNGGGYHDIGFRLNSGTFFKPNINNNATYKDRVIAVGPAPASMKADASAAFYNCTALRSFDATVDTSITTNLSNAWLNCSSLVSFPLINTASVTNFVNAWNGCSNLTSFPLINTASATSLASAWSACSGITFFPLISTAAVTNFDGTWNGCSGLTSFPLINTAAGTNFLAAWGQCSNLTSFPLINTAAGTNFQSAWNQCSNLTSFPLINTAAGTNFTNAWLGCNKLTSFPLINTGSGTTFFQAWAYCSSLTSFPLINTAAGTNFQNAWGGCTGLTSFPLINTAAGTNFLLAWYGCSSLTSFPLINMAAGTSFGETWRGCTGLTSFPAITFNSATNLNAAWYGCTNLATFPANAFNTTGTLVATAFGNTFLACALTSTSIENILTSLVTNGQSNITLGLNGGTNAGAATWTANAIAAYNTLISRGWTITRNA